MSTVVPAPTSGTYTIYARGTDATDTCNTGYIYAGGGADPGTAKTFNWVSCSETKKVVLNPSVTTPLGSGQTTLSAQVQLISNSSATADASEVSLDGSTWTATVNYTPAEDSTTPVTLYMRSSAGACGTISDTTSVPVDTMAAPVVSAFTGPAIESVLSVSPLGITATDNVAVTHYMVTENNTPPAAGAAGWAASVTSYTVGSDGNYTLYPWAKDAAGNVSAVYGSPLSVTVDTTAPSDGTLTATGDQPGEIPLSWSGFTDAGGSGIALYDLRASSAGAVANCGAGTSVYTGAGTSFTHTGLAVSETWWYRLCAIDNANNTSTGATASATTQNCTEAGTTSIAISPDPGAGGTITYNVATLMTGSVANGASNPLVQYSFDGSNWSAPEANGSTFDPPNSTVGTAYFRSVADGSCAGNTIYSSPLSRNMDTRVNALNVVTDALAEQNGTNSMRVTFTYCDDLNGSGLFRVEYKLTTENWTDGAVIARTKLVADGSAGDLDGSKNETVIVLLSGLTADTTYDVRMTYVDDDTLTVNAGLNGTTSGDSKEHQYVDQVDLITWADDPMLHNALAFACSIPGYRTQASCESNTGTWSLDGKYPGGWGTPTSQYGGILCKTCHVKNSDNIKRVRTSISFPNSAIMPNGLTATTVAFTTAEDGASDFGNDSGGHATSSKVCEVCHSQTLYHKYNTAGQSNLGHQNQADCTKCHAHKGGFRASCTVCHGNPPTDMTELVENGSTPADKTNSATFGKHVLHAESKGFDCKTCHNGWENSGQMPNGGDLNIGFKPSVNAQFNSATPSAIDGGTYNGRTNGSYTADGTTSTTVNQDDSKTCAAVYCHGYATPVWDDAALNQPCGSCHGQTGQLWGAGDKRNAAPDGSADGGKGGKDLSGNTTGTKVGKHAKHMAYSQFQTNDPCNLCHDGFGYGLPTHVNGKTNVKLKQVAKSEIAGAGGAGVNAVAIYNTTDSRYDCSNIDCHAGTYWDSANTLTCTSAQGCHSYPPTSAVGSIHASNISAATIGDVDHDIRGDGDVTTLRSFHDECTTCHGYKSNGDNTISGFTALTAAEITSMGGDPAIQPNLSTYNPSTNPGGWHQDGSVGMNGNGNGNPLDDAGYNRTNGGCDNSACHANDAAHRLPVGGGTVSDITLGDIGPGSCGYCHDSGRGGAPTIGASDSHVDADGAGGTYTAGDCLACHSGHWADGMTNATNRIGVSTIYNRTVVAGGNDTGTLVPTMSKQYPNHDSYIRLGGVATAGYNPTTEAEYCWGCHDTVGVSEWGTNTNALTGNGTYDFGDLYTDTTSVPGTKRSNWITGFWRSGKGRASGNTSNPFWYKRGAIQSTHAVNFDTSTAAVSNGNTLGFNRTESLDAVANIRCTYCHDVHGTHNGANGDPATQTGTADQPYLRGTWLTNPYPEDGAPQWGMANWTDNNNYNLVPRGSASSSNTGITAISNAGGYWIDQNSGNPTGLTTTSTATQRLTVADNTSGLCEQCHGANKNGNWTQAALSSLDYTTTGNEASNGLWVSGYNGHANMVVGGLGRGANASPESYARNIFSRTRRGSATLTQTTSSHSTVDMGLATLTTTSRGYSYRGAGAGYGWTPSAGNNASAFRNFAWGPIYNGTQSVAAGSTIAANTTQLTMTNVATEGNVDAQANYHTFTCSKCHNPHASRLPKLMITNCLDTNHNTWEDNATYTGTNPGAPFANTRHSQWASAQNCHRLDANAPLATSPSQALGTGWNKATPWQEFTNPNATRTNPNP